MFFDIKFKIKIFLQKLHKKKFTNERVLLFWHYYGTLKSMSYEQYVNPYPKVFELPDDAESLVLFGTVFWGFLNN